jgi:hypothetical protein
MFKMNNQDSKVYSDDDDEYWEWFFHYKAYRELAERAVDEAYDRNR